MIPPHRNERGMALLLVLVIIALLTALLMELAYSTLIDKRLTETFRDSTKAYYLAAGGITAGRILLQQDSNRYDASDEMWYTGITSYPVGQGTISVSIRDLGGKLAVNALVSGNNPDTVMVNRFYRLFEELEIEHLAEPAELVAALIDWLDSNDTPYDELVRDNNEHDSIATTGAENSYYQGLREGYACKNNKIESLEELLRVKGFSKELLEIIGPYLTVNGTSKINLNTASDKVLLSLSDDMTEEAASKIIEYRTTTPIKDVSDLSEVLDSEIYSILGSQELSTKSQYYLIDSEALVNDGRQRLVAEVNKENNTLLYIRVK